MKEEKVPDRRCSGGHRRCNIFCRGAHTMRIIERFTVRLVNAVLNALRQEVEKRYQLGALEAGQHVDQPDVWLTNPEYYEEIYDALTGVKLDPVLVAKARNTEMRFLVDELNAYKYDSVDNCLRMIGKRPIPVNWVDVNKGGAQRPEVRSRLAVAETRHRTTLSEEDNAQTFSATPLYEALRLLVSFGLSPRNQDEKSHVLMIIDITRAHAHCTMRRQVWVEPPAEDLRSKEEGVCGLLLATQIYGLRDAGMNFEMLTRQVMDKLDFSCGLWTPCVFVHRETNMHSYVYGDNFVIKGVRRELYDFFEHLKVHMWAKSEGVSGPDPGQGDVREVVCLNRVFRWCLLMSGRPEALEIEAHARHADILVHQLNLQNAKTLATPGVKSTSSDVGHTLPLDMHTALRSMCMRANYLAEDRPDVRFACRGFARLMSEPREAGWERLKTLGRYVAGVPRLVQRMERQDLPELCLALSDADHVGCLTS